MAETDDKKEPQKEASEASEAPQYVTIEQLQSLLKTTLAPVTKAIQEIQSSKQEKDESEDDSKLTLKKAMSRIQALEEEKLSAHRAKQELELRNTVKDALTRAGVSPHLMKAAMAVLVDADKRIQRSEDGDIIFKDDRFGERSLDDGLRDFLRSEEGKSFLPPKGARGSNDRRYTGSEPVPAKMSESEAGQALTDLLLRGAQ